jgi:DNA-binding MarR family transcriptional regulator
MKTVEEHLELPRAIQMSGHNFIMAIVLTSRTLSSEGRRLLRHSGLTEVQFNVLMLLKYQFKKGATQVELSKRILVNRANVTGLVDRLERDGLVERVRQKNDRRANTVSITGKGLKKLAAAEPGYFDGIRKVAQSISEPQRQETIEVLLSVCELIEKERNTAVSGGAASDKKGRT